MATPSIPHKRCTKCNQDLPATEEYFQKQPHGLYGLNSRCKQCVKAYDKERQSRPEVKERMKIKRKEWGENNRDRLAENQRRYYKNNADEIREHEKEASKPRRKRYQEKHPELNNKTRARRAGAIGTHTNIDIESQLKSQKGLCWWCGKKLKKKWHIDHRIPLIRGGTNWPENIVISCPTCNLSKGGKMPWEWNGRLV